VNEQLLTFWGNPVNFLSSSELRLNFVAVNRQRCKLIAAAFTVVVGRMMQEHPEAYPAGEGVETALVVARNFRTAITLMDDEAALTAHLAVMRAATNIQPQHYRVTLIHWAFK